MTKKWMIRRKTLVILTVMLMVALGLVYFSTPNKMASQIKKQEQLGNQNAAMVFKEKLIRFFPGSEEARWEALSLADRILQGNERMMIGPNFTQGSADQGLPIDTEEVISLLQEVAQAQKVGMWKYSAYKKMAQLYRLQGDFENAEENFQIASVGFLKDEKDFQVAEVDKELVAMYLESEQLEKGLSLVEKSLQTNGDQYRSEFLSLKGDICFQMGDNEKAIQSYQRALIQVEKEWADSQMHLDDKEANVNATLESQPVYRHSRLRLDLLEQMKSQKSSEMSSVKGQILASEVPMSNVMVYLIEEQEYDGRISDMSGLVWGNSIKTDEQGRFEFNRISAGRYFIVLGVLPEDLEGLGKYSGLETFDVEAGTDKVMEIVFQPRVKITQPTGQQTFTPGQALKVAWQEVPQAASYDLHITLKLENGYSSRVYHQNIKDNFDIVNPQGLFLREMNFVTWTDGYVLSPSAILGSFYPGAEIFFRVEAIDDQGKSISDSEGYVLQLNGNYPFIQVVETTPLSLGDQSVIAKQYDKAIVAYQQALEENSSDPASLLSLARLYGYGWTEGTVDLDKAVNYYTKLLKITREKFIVEEAAATAAQSGNDVLALKLFEEIEPEFEQDSFWYHLMGELYLKTGNIKKAVSYYLKYLDGQKEFRDLGPIIAMLYEDDVEGAIALLHNKAYSEKPRYNAEGQTEEPADVRTLLSSLEKMEHTTTSVLSKADFNQYLLQIIQIDGRNRFEQVRELQAELKKKDQGKNDVRIQVLHELVKDRR